MLDAIADGLHRHRKTSHQVVLVYCIVEKYSPRIYSGRYPSLQSIGVDITTLTCDHVSLHVAPGEVGNVAISSSGL